MQRTLWYATAALVLVAGAPRATQAQNVYADLQHCDFDIADDIGRFTSASTMHLTGQPGAPTQLGQFIIVNSNSMATDPDLDGYNTNTACDHPALYIQDRQNLINVANPTLAIPGDNIVIRDLPRRLGWGDRAEVSVFVSVPRGTVAGRYVGLVEIRDSVRFAIATPTRDVLNRDFIAIEVIVVEETGLAIVDPDSPNRLDSLVIRARSGQRASGVFRVANLGNTNLNDVRFSATDLRSESAVNLVIPAENITFSAPSFSTLGVSDTARVTVTVRVPRGILGGRYRGTLIVSGNGGPPGQQTTPGNNTTQEIPLILIVTSNRGILFANNPVRAVTGDIGQIAFNGDPGTGYQLGIFDMTGAMVFKAQGTVFAGIAGTQANPTAGADFAVSFSWPLVNGLGEQVASGMYLVVVESTVQGLRQVSRDKLMVIR